MSNIKVLNIDKTLYKLSISAPIVSGREYKDSENGIYILRNCFKPLVLGDDFWTVEAEPYNLTSMGKAPVGELTLVLKESDYNSVREKINLLYKKEIWFRRTGLTDNAVTLNVNKVLFRECPFHESIETKIDGINIIIIEE
jgi:hypothetical protein